MLNWFKRRSKRRAAKPARRVPASVVYYDPASSERQHSSFRGGAACWVVPGEDRACDESFATLELSPVVYEGLLQLGPMDKFYSLPHEGPLGDYEEGVLLPEGLEEAAGILRDAALSLGDEVRDVYCAYGATPGNIDYRMKLPPEELREGFRLLADFLDGAREKGHGVQLWL